jgi:hypothetical protein
VHSELGPGYRDAVVESFLDKIGKEIDARVDNRLDRVQGSKPHRHPRDLSVLLAILSIGMGIAITAITLSIGHGEALIEMLLGWAAIAFINYNYGRNHRAADYRHGDRR